MVDSPLRILIVDDEEPARARLRGYLKHDARVEIVGEAADGLAAVEVIEELRPDLVLLDVQMPELDGFGVLDALEVDPMPHVIFVTAHDAFAVRAFEVHAVDYLLKPVSRERLAAAIGRVVLRPPGDLAAGGVTSLVAEQPLERFLVRSRGRMILIPASDVDWIGAEGNYVSIHVRGADYLVRTSLQTLERRLPTQRFARIHRSTIVNLERVVELQPWSHGDLIVFLHDGTELRLSRRYKDRLSGILEG